MSDFIQLHMLVSYPPSNLNRDDLGRPKTAVMGGTQRLRISSQSLKRAWRTSDVFSANLAGSLGVRTKDMGSAILKSLQSGIRLSTVIKGDLQEKASFKPVDGKKALSLARQIAEVFGKLKKGDDSVEIEQLAHFNPEEISAIEKLIEKIAASGKDPDDNDKKILMKSRTAVDIAMFGRMLASSPEFNTEAAVQVAHAVTVHEVAVEDDYFTAVDDLNRGEEDAGAGHLGETEFASGLFYTYICIDKTLLEKNLGENKDLVKTAIKALVEAATKVAPTGKQNSFASRAYASYLLVEKGSKQPRSLSVAYLGAIRDSMDLLGSAIRALEDTRKKIDSVYGKCWADELIMDAHAGTGSLDTILEKIC
jgi:CRISPR system Cascade subunit CasC